MSGKGVLSMKDAVRYSTIRASLDGHVTVNEASRQLDLSRRRVFTLRSRVLAEGADEVRHGNAGRSPSNRTPDAIRRKVIEPAPTDYATAH